MNKRALMVICTIHILTHYITGVFAQEPSSSTQDDADLPYEEIIVTEHSIDRLREQVSEAEDRMYELFNELNDDDRYDIHCHREAETGTLLKRKVCRPEYLLDASEMEARAMAGAGISGRNFPRPTATPAAAQNFHGPKLQEKMQDAMQENPEFFDAVVKYNQLKNELEGVLENE